MEPKRVDVADLSRRYGRLCDWHGAKVDGHTKNSKTQDIEIASVTTCIPYSNSGFQIALKYRIVVGD